MSELHVLCVDVVDGWCLDHVCKHQVIVYACGMRPRCSALVDDFGMCAARLHS